MMIDVFERIRYVKDIVQTMYPKMTREEIKMALKRIVRATRYKIDTLSGEDKVILSLIIKRGIQPSTAYSWYRVLSLPDYLQQEIRERKISTHQAIRLNLESNRPREVLAGELRKDILAYVEKIAQKDFLRGGEYALK